MSAKNSIDTIRTDRKTIKSETEMGRKTTTFIFQETNCRNWTLEDMA